ncbi:recombinase family protein [Paraburkholderia sediminicola]|uniref:recombinase family protein n=1 Tax=Paraburkholderia sediminicola TaxID=458836 RepID=UPI0038B922AF
MSQSSLSLTQSIDPHLAGVLITNMLEAWLTAGPALEPTEEAVDEHQDHSKPAYIYIRQSTLAQVRHHQESTERQYALRDKALALGWPPTAVRILDRDLGQSGAQMTGREDFKTLVADVSMGQVGAVFGCGANSDQRIG